MRPWTVLIYANGQNELAPELAETFQELKNLSLDSDLTVLIQLGLAPVQVVQTIRPAGAGEVLRQEGWVGVRRYEIRKGLPPKLHADLGMVNMADPGLLQEFLIWGMTFRPAQLYMLILAGHSAGFLGVLVDYSDTYPSLMPLLELCQALRAAGRVVGHNIDLLVADLCYLNSIEFIYECGAYGIPVCRAVIMPTLTLPLEGLPYAPLLHRLSGRLGCGRPECGCGRPECGCGRPECGTAEAARDLVAVIGPGMVKKESGIVAIAMDGAVLERLKHAARPFVMALLNGNDGPPLPDLAQPVLETAHELVLAAHGDYPLLTIWIPEESRKLAAYLPWYKRLAICRAADPNPHHIQPPPARVRVRVPFSLLLANLAVYNPTLSDDAIENLATSLGWIKKRK